MCTADAIKEAAEDEVMNRLSDHHEVYNTFNDLGYNVTVRPDHAELDGEDEEDEAAHLDDQGRFSGVVYVEVEGAAVETPNEIVFSGRCVGGKPGEFELSLPEDDGAREE